MTGPRASQMPLAGIRVLLPRADGSAADLIRLLAAAGAQPHVVPLISIEPPADLSALDAAVLELGAGDFDWVGFTSANAVRSVLTRAQELQLTPVVPADTRVAAVGAATAAALRSAGLPVDLLPDRSGPAAQLAEIWPTAGGPGSTVLLPRSEIGLPALGQLLSAKGYRVVEVDAYRTRVLPVPAPVADDLRAGRYNAVLLTSPSTVTALTRHVLLPPTVIVGCLGPSTAAAAALAGLTVRFVAKAATVEALREGLIDAVRTREGGR